MPPVPGRGSVETPQGYGSYRELTRGVYRRFTGGTPEVHRRYTGTTRSQHRSNTLAARSQRPRTTNLASRWGLHGFGESTSSLRTRRKLWSMPQFLKVLNHPL